MLLSGSSLTTGINLAYNVAVARLLGPDGFGQATAVYTLLTLISAITLSYQLISAKVVAQQMAATGGKLDFRRIHQSAWVCGLLIAAGLLIFQGQITAYLKLPTPFLVVLLAVGAAFYVPLGSRRGLVQGAHGFRSLANNLMLEGAMRLGCSLLAVWLGFGVKGVIAANAAAMAIAYFSLAPPKTSPDLAPIQFGRIHREVAHAVVFFAGQMLINNSDIVLVKHFFSPTLAGLYAVIAMVGRVIFSLCQSVVNSMVPVVAGTRTEERKSVSLIATALLLVLGIGSVLAAALRFMPAWVWTTLFGAGFVIRGSHGISYLLALYAVTTVVYSLSSVIITYVMSYKIAYTSWVQLAFSGLMILGILEFHTSLEEVILVQLVSVSILLCVVAVLFSRSVRFTRNVEIPENVASGDSLKPIRLIRRVSEDEVIAEFLKSDFEKDIYGDYWEPLHNLVYNPDFGSDHERAKRRALLSIEHLALWEEIPSNTQWYEAELEEDNLSQMRVFPRAQWRKIARGSFNLLEVAETMKQKSNISGDPFLEKIAALRAHLRQDKLRSNSVVLIGLNENEPLAIIDGNHRFVAAVLEQQTEKLRFLCGFSPAMGRCCWYKTNPLTLTRYAKNLLKQIGANPKAELASLSRISG